MRNKVRLCVPHITHKNYLSWKLLPPANEICKGCVFTGVCMSTGVGCASGPSGVCHTPRADTAPGQIPPLWADTSPWTDTPSRYPPWAVHVGMHILSPCPVHAGIHQPLAQCMLGYGQQAGRTHPTGMHSCGTCTGGSK